MIYECAICLPLVSFLVVGLCGRLLGDRISSLLSCALLLGSTVAGGYIFYEVVFEQASLILPLYTWFEVGNLNVTWMLRFDPLSTTMVCVVTLISFLVHLYSVGYMHKDPGVPRFMAYLGLFTFMMLMLVTGESLVQIFFGWEGVGLASYLLIGFWFHKESANRASLKAFLVNRVGDFGLVLGMALLFAVFQTLNLTEILTGLDRAKGEILSIGAWDIPLLEVVALLLFMGAMGKSAQLGLHTWLPDAMEGPTPVSALIHAATMVTAGVFLVARLSPLYALTPFTREVIIFVGASTALFAGTVALTQNDIKRVIAYSTCSQLGYMFFALGVSAYSAAMFHLLTHAFFKALLFLGAGSVIHGMSNEQDMRRMGGLFKHMPYTAGVMWIGSLALAGVPFFAGFYSKDAILEAAWNSQAWMAPYAYGVGIVVAVLTAFYSWRLLLMTFHGPARGNDIVMGHVHEPGASMSIPLFILSIGALFAGYGGIDFFLNGGNSFWQKTLVLAEEGVVSLPPLIHALPIGAGLLGILLAYGFYHFFPRWPDKVRDFCSPLYTFFSHKWYFDELYDKIFIRTAFKIGNFFWKRGDQKTINTYGPDGIAASTLAMSARVSTLQSGYLYHYAAAMILGIVFMVGGYLLLYTLGGSQ